MMWLGSPDENESPWFPLFMVLLCAGLFVTALYFERPSGASMVGLLGAFNVWRFVSAFKKWRIRSQGGQA
jgi:hypothetical protein